MMRIQRQPPHRLGKLPWLMGRHEQALPLVFDHFWDRPHACGHNGKTMRQRFEQRDRHTFVVAGLHVGVSLGQELSFTCALDRAHIANVGVKVVSANLGIE